MFSSLKEADKVHGGLSRPSKMPCLAYGLPAKYCKTGAKLHKVPGSVCASCYALRGNYMFPSVVEAQERRYNALKHPQWVDAIVYSLKRRRSSYFRWHDSGDLQGMWHLENIVEVAVRCPEIKFWLATRENALVSQYLRNKGQFPKNLIVRVSGAMVDGYAPIKFYNTATVTTRSDEVTCPAYQQGGKCGDCRKCWDPTIRNVVFPKH